MDEGVLVLEGHTEAEPVATPAVAHERDLWRRGVQEQRERGKVGFAGANLDGKGHTVADRVAQRPVDDRVLRKLAGWHRSTAGRVGATKRLEVARRF